MKEPRWIERRALVLLHAETLAEDGGLSGIRDENALESALSRPRHLFTYKRQADLARLAAAYAAGITNNHPFSDGNKRAAFLSIGLFLELNGCRLTAGKAEATVALVALAAGEVSGKELAVWIRGNCTAG